jgi:hypothetical protein
MEPRPEAIDQPGQQDEQVALDDPTVDAAEAAFVASPGVTDAPMAVPVGDEFGEPEAGAQQPAAAPAVGGSRARWLIGGGVAIASVAALVLAATLLGARPLPEALRYMPADSAVVVELRPELPGDQREELGTFLARFPGFADRSILDQKIDEVLDRAVSVAFSGSIDYPTQVEPLLAGPMALSMSANGLRGATTGVGRAGLLLVATTDGDVSCAAMGGSGTVVTTYRDVEIRWIDREMACAMHGRFMLLGAPVSIQGGLDARLDGHGMDGSADYKAARAELEGDQLATIFGSGRALEGLIPDASSALGMDLPETEIPAWMIAGLRAESEALVLEAITAPVSVAERPPGAPTSAPVAESRFAGVLPADTLGYAEVHGVGAMLAQGLGALRADPAGSKAFEQVEAALVLLGGADNLVGWIEEAGIAVIPTADGIGGALLIRGTDAEAAAARVTQVRNLLALVATGTDITVRETEHAGVIVTIVDLGDLGSLLGGLGGLGDLGGLGELGIPDAVGEVRLQFAIAVRDDLVLIAVGSGVAERILDVEASSSLQATTGYVRAMALAGTRSSFHAYVAADAAVTLAAGLATGDDLEAWNREVAPYVEHLAGIAWSTTFSSTGHHSRLVLTVK